jgi:prepilin-type N-terminal cleavage/methylation domain-containing protein
MSARRRSQRGFTLIELMVSLVLFAFVTAGMLSVATTMARGFRQQEATITTESATRSTLDFLSEAVRTASPGVPALNITNALCGTQAIEVINNDTTIVGKPTTHDSDRLTMVFPSGWIYTSLSAAFTSTDLTMNLAHSGSQLAINDQVLITDFTQGHVMNVTGVAGNVISVTGNGCGTPVVYGRGALVIRVKRAGFFVKMLPGDANNRAVPALMMDPTPDTPNDGDEEPIAEGIEDLQVAVAIDDAVTVDVGTTITEIGTGINDDEWVGNFPGEVIPATLNTLTVRAIRISVIARNAREAPGINFYSIPALEDRATVVTNDAFRRRLLSTIIEVRNLGVSP